MRPHLSHPPISTPRSAAPALTMSGGRPRAAQPSGRQVRTLHIAQKIAGGIASYFDEIAGYQNVAFGEANVQFLVPAGEERQLTAVAPAQIMTFTATRRRPDSLLQFGKAALFAIRTFQPDIVHLHSSFAGAVVRALLKVQAGAPKIIYCPHGWAFGIETSSALKRAYAAVERHLAARTNAILVNSEAEHRLALCYGLPADKIDIIDNGIAWAPIAPRKRRSGSLNIAFIGRHDRQKGLDILLDTVERFDLPELDFHIVGESVVGRGLPARGRSRANVTLHGWLERSNLSAFLRDMDAVIMPSRWEAFGLVAVEAMRAGVPVIASNRGSLPDVVRDGIGGIIFDLDDPDALGRVLQSLDHRRLQRLGATARALFESDYGAERMNRLTHELYLRVLGDAAAEPATGRAATHHQPTTSAAAA